MKKMLLFAFLGFAHIGISQSYLPGLWKGMMTKGGLDSKTGYTFELFLEVDGAELSGRSYVHINKGEIIEMQIKGKLNADLSLNLYDIEFINPDGETLPPEFGRKYQLLYKRSAWESETSLDGYWQQIIDSPFGKQRKRGRIFLEKVTISKA